MTFRVEQLLLAWANKHEFEMRTEEENVLKQTHELEQMRLEARAGCVLEFCVFQRELPAKQFHIVVEGPGPLPAVMPLQAPSRVFVDYVPPPPTLVAELRGLQPCIL